MEAAEQYRTLMARGDIQLCVSSGDLLKEYSDKELRIIMCHNGVLMNVFCEAAQKYKEKNKYNTAVSGTMRTSTSTSANASILYKHQRKYKYERTYM